MGEAGPVCGDGDPIVPPAQEVVPGRHKRYHPLYTLQTQGRMHVQM
jgi:hypothetical protein